MNKEELLKAHQQNRDNTEYTEELVEILGGIDNIIHLILSSNDLNIENDKMLQIHQTITQKSGKQTLIQQHTGQQNDEMSDPPRFTYYFDPNNDFLHVLCGNIKANKIRNVLLSKYNSIVALSMLIVWWLLWINVGDGYIFYIYSYLELIYVLVYMIVRLLSVNQKSFYLMIRNFTFWFKLYNSITFGFWLGIHRYYVENDNIESIGADVPIFVMGSIFFILVIVTESLIDGVYLKLWIKIIIASGITLMLSATAIHFMFYAYINGEDNSIIKVKVVGPTIYISCYSMIGSSSSALAIFLSKNAINLIRKRGKCLLIKLPTPYLKWIDNINDNTIIQDNVVTVHELDQLKANVDTDNLEQIIDEDCNNNDEIYLE